MLPAHAVRQQVRTIDKDQPLSRPITLKRCSFETGAAALSTWRSSAFRYAGAGAATVGI